MGAFLFCTLKFYTLLTICKNCNNFDSEKWVCKICGCYLDKKAKMNTENCPECKW